MVDSRRDVSEEVSLCSKMYPGFEDIAESIRDMLTAGDEFVSRTQAASSLKIPLGEEEVQNSFRKGESLDLRPEASRDAFEEAASIACDGVLRMYPDVWGLEETVQEFRHRFVDEAFDCSQESFDFADDKVADLLSLTPPGEALGRDLCTCIVSFALSMLYRGHLERERPDTVLWDGGNCPVCGHKPHFGLLRSDDGARVLQCWLCGTGWQYPRLQCPYCENTDHEKLGYFVVDSMDGCRLHFCRECDHYLKIFDLREYQGDDAVLAIHNMATLTYDVVAHREGFTPGSELHWIDAEDKDS